MTAAAWIRRYGRLGPSAGPDRLGFPAIPPGAIADEMPPGVSGADVLFAWTAASPEVNAATGEAFPAIFYTNCDGPGWEPYRKDVNGVPVIHHGSNGTLSLGPLRGFGYASGWTDTLDLDSNLPYTIYIVGSVPAAATGGSYVFSYGNSNTNRLGVFKRIGAGLMAAGVVSNTTSDVDYSGQTGAADTIGVSAFEVTSTTVQAYFNGASNGSTAATNTSGAVGGTPDSILVAGLVDTGFYESTIAAVYIVKGAYSADIDAWIQSRFAVGGDAQVALPDHENLFVDFDPALIGGGGAVDESQGLAWSNTDGTFSTDDISSDGGFTLDGTNFPYSFFHQSGAYDHSAQVPCTAYVVVEPSSADISNQSALWSRYTVSDRGIWIQLLSSGEVRIGVRASSTNVVEDTTGAGITAGARYVIAAEWTSLTAVKIYVNGVKLADATITSTDPVSPAAVAMGFMSGVIGSPSGSKIFRTLHYSGAYGATINTYLTDRYLGPASAPTTILDYDPDAATDALADGTAVASNGTGTTFTEQGNGRVAAVFDGNGWLEASVTPFATLSALANGLAFYVVCERTDFTGGALGIVGYDEAAGGVSENFIGLNSNSGGAAPSTVSALCSDDSATTAVDVTDSIFGGAGAQIVSAHFTTTQIASFIDGVSNTPATHAANDPLDLDRFTIGANPLFIAPAGSFIGKVYRVMMCDAAHGAEALRYLTEQYL